MKKENYCRKIPLLNEFRCRGRIVGKGVFDSEHSYITVFVKTRRKPNYIKVYYESKNFPSFEMNQNISVQGYIASSVLPYNFEDRIDQHCFAENIKINRTELSEVFEIENIGFSYKHSFTKVFLGGKILQITISKDKLWKIIKVQDYKCQVITLQYSTMMRVNDINLKVNDFVFLSASVISKRKMVNNSYSIDYENLIVEDIAKSPGLSKC